MNNLHKIPITNLTQREIANIWDTTQNMHNTVMKYNGIIYYGGYNGEWWDIWDNDGYSKVALKRWQDAGSPMPDLSQIIEFTVAR
jgi:hypothetical protein